MRKVLPFFTKQPPPPATHHFFLLSVSVRGSSISGGGGGGIGSSPQKDPQIGKFARVESLGTKRSYTKMLTPPEELAVHMAKINGTWVCTTCSKNFHERSKCRIHVESHHITTNVYRCSKVRSLKSQTCDIGKLFFLFLHYLRFEVTQLPSSLAANSEVTCKSMKLARPSGKFFTKKKVALLTKPE